MQEENMTELGNKTMDEEYNPEGTKKIKWQSFVEADVANFFSGFKLEKMTLEDGNGNKAKLVKTKDGGIKVECTSTTTI